MRWILSPLLVLVPGIVAAQVPVGNEFQVNTYTTSDQRRAAVGSDGAGGFVVAWVSLGSSGTDTSGGSIQAQRYAPDGSRAGSQFQVNTYTLHTQYSPAVGPDGNGGFVVAWMSYGSDTTDTDGWGIQGQRFASDGSPAGGEFQVNAYTTGGQYDPAVGPDGAGGFVVAWQSIAGVGGTDTSGFSVRAQRFASDGTPAGPEFQINTYTTGPQVLPAVAPDGAGGFVAAWMSDGSSGTDTSGWSIQRQSYAADGLPKGAEFQVNTNTYGDELVPEVGPFGEHGFVVTWTSTNGVGTDDDGDVIQAQLYCSLLFADGFESGDTSAWSTTVP